MPSSSLRPSRALELKPQSGPLPSSVPVADLCITCITCRRPVAVSLWPNGARQCKACVWVCMCVWMDWWWGWGEGKGGGGGLLRLLAANP